MVVVPGYFALKTLDESASGCQARCLFNLVLRHQKCLRAESPGNLLYRVLL